MRAVAVDRFGAEPRLMDLPAPRPGADELLVRIRAAGLNPADWKIAAGLFGADIPHRFPLILGNDAAGVVEQVGAEVAGFAPGDRVYGQFMRTGDGLGGYCEYGVVAVSGTVSPIPEGMTFVQAAAIPTASMTAYNLVDTAGVDDDRTVLVVGATGGVGRSVVQLAADRSARVIATARPDAAEDLRDLGAVATVDPGAGSLVEQFRSVHPDGIDILIDLVSDAAELDALSRLVRPAGVVVTSVFTADVDALADRGIRAVNLDNEPSSALLDTLTELFVTGRLRIDVEREVPLAEAPEALRRNRSGGARGKTVIVV